MAINESRIKALHEKDRIDNLIGRVAIKIGLHRPAGVPAAVAETHAKFFPAGGAT